MKVCHLLNTAARGGAETQVLELVRHTRRDDVSYTVCYLGDGNDLVPEFEAEGARVVSLASRTKTPQLDPAVAPRLLSLLRRGDFDVVHSHMPYVHVFGRLGARGLGGAEMVSTQHTLQETLPTVSRLLGRATRPLDDATVAVSEGVQRSFTGRSNRYRESGLDGGWCTIYNGIDVEGFNEKVDRLARRDGGVAVDGDGLRIVNIGRFVPEKAQLDLIAAMDRVRDRLPDAHLYVVGSSGPLEGRLRAEVADRGLEDHVSVVYHDGGFEIHEYYAVADVFVSASVREGMPITLLEAMAAELPVVATDIPGVSEVVDDGVTGSLVSPNAPTELAGAIAALGSATDTAAYGQRGYRRAAEYFHIERTVTTYLDLYRDLLVSQS